MITIQLFLQSLGIFPLLTTSLHISVTHCRPASPDASNILTTTSDCPAAFPDLELASADLTSSTEIFSQGPLTASTTSNPLRSHSNSSFNSFSKYSFQTSFISFSSVRTFCSLFLIQALPTTSVLLLTICFTTLNSLPFASALLRFSENSCLSAAWAAATTRFASLLVLL